MPIYVIFFEDNSRYKTIVLPIIILSVFSILFVLVFLSAYNLIRIELYPHAIRINNLIMMKGIQYKYSDIVKVQLISQVSAGVQPFISRIRDINSNPGFILYFKDDFQIEITAETYSNTREMLDCINAMVESYTLNEPRNPLEA